MKNPGPNPEPAPTVYAAKPSKRKQLPARPANEKAKERYEALSKKP